MKYTIYIAIYSLLVSVTEINAQVINSGELTILPGTEVTILEGFTNTSSANVVNNGTLYFYENYVNNGQFSFVNIALGVSNQGTIHFLGTQRQQITSPSMSVFYNVVFDNPTLDPAFRLNGSIYVENQADFTMGIVDSQGITNSFIFGRDADPINTSNGSYVLGAVQKEGDMPFEFPVGGNGFYRRLSITAPEDQNDLFSAQYFPENSNNNYSHDLTAGIIEFIDSNEYWSLDREAGTSNVLLSLQWDENTTSPELLDGPLSGIHVVRWDEAQGFWVDEGGIIDEVNKTVTTVTEVTGYGIFALGRVKEDLILPGGIVVYNLLTPNGDGDNDFLRIEGLDLVSDNSVEIFNRHGVKVFETSNYNETDNVFRGFSQGRATLNRGEQLPTGTYFYILKYTYNSQRIKKAGYLYINGKD